MLYFTRENSPTIFHENEMSYEMSAQYIRNLLLIKDEYYYTNGSAVTFYAIPYQL